MIELVLVIALMGILAVSVVTMTVSSSRQNIEIAAKKIRSDIEHARGLAMMKKGAVFGVTFNAAANTYTVYEGASASPVKDPLTKQNLVETFARWGNVSITGGNYTVEFGPTGAPTTGGGGSVTITDGTNNKTIGVLAGTGRVTVQ